jgi:hypothetical protein
MLPRKGLPFASVALALTLVASPSAGYIHFPPPTLRQMCKQSIWIALWGRVSAHEMKSIWSARIAEGRVSAREMKLRQAKLGEGGEDALTLLQNLSSESGGQPIPPGSAWPAAGSESCVGVRKGHCEA